MAQYTNFGFMRPGGEEEEGPTAEKRKKAEKTPPTVAPPNFDKPTYADSMALYENAIALKKFYEENPEYSKDLKRTQPIETLPVRLEQSLQGIKNKENRNFRTNVIVDGKRTAAVVPVGDFNKPVVNNPNQYYQREIENSVLNMNAPMALIDRRIPPDVVQFYREKVKKNPDLVTIATYSPERIKPKMPPIGLAPVDTNRVVENTPPPPVVKKKIITPEERRKLIKSSAVTGRVSFGTSDNRPMNSPGAAGRGGYGNRLDGRGAVPTAVQKILSLFSGMGR